MVQGHPCIQVAFPNSFPELFCGWDTLLDAGLSSESNDLSQRPEAANLLGIYSSLKNQNLEKSIKEFNGKNFSEFKEKLSEILIERIEPISKEIKKLLKDEKYLDDILLEGSQKAGEIASKKIKGIKEIVGF